METRINFSLDGIPDPQECHEVPVGAVIPAEVPFWVVYPSGSVKWDPRGYQNDFVVQANNLPHLTVELYTVNKGPTPSESPIIIDRMNNDHCEFVRGQLAMWLPDRERWCVVSRNDNVYEVLTSQISEWRPATVRVSGVGVWNERDKRARIGRNGVVWRWSAVDEVWMCSDSFNMNFGSLEALGRVNGADYLVGFVARSGGDDGARA